MASQLKQVSAAATIYTGRAMLKSVTLTPAAALSTCTIDDSTDGSATDYLALQAVASGASVQWLAKDNAGVLCATGIRVATVVGAAALVTVEFEPFR